MNISLPKCAACGTKFTWKQAFQAQRLLYEYTHCPYCEKQQYIIGRKKETMLLMFIAVSPLIINLFVDFTWFGFLLTYIAVLLVLLVFTPFVYSLKAEDPNFPLKINQ